MTPYNSTIFITDQDHLVGVKEFHVAKALLEGNEEHSQCANESRQMGGWCLALAITCTSTYFFAAGFRHLYVSGHCLTVYFLQDRSSS